MERIVFPPKSTFGFFSTVPFFGANCKFRKMVRRKLLSRVSFKNEIETMWHSLHYSVQETHEILECIRINNGWPNSLFLPSDPFLALAPLEGIRYDSFNADTDTVNDLFYILSPREREKKSAWARLKQFLVVGSDIPLVDTSLISPENTIAEVLQMIESEIKRDQ